jgi:hypothetical protein
MVAAAYLENSRTLPLLSFFGFSMFSLACVPKFIKIRWQMAGSLESISICSPHSQNRGKKHFQRALTPIFRGDKRLKLSDFVVLIKFYQTTWILWTSEHVSFWSTFHFYPWSKHPKNAVFGGHFSPMWASMSLIPDTCFTHRMTSYESFLTTFLSIGSVYTFILARRSQRITI